MAKWIALFRGINVGGNNILPMAKLVEALEGLKCKNIKTYIQSGNVVFDSASKQSTALAKRISDAINRAHGFLPNVFLITPAEFKNAVESNPYPKATNDPKTLHFFFLKSPAKSADIDSLDAAKAVGESYELTDQVFYLLAENGIGRSKLAAKAEKLLGVATTARNYRTISKLLSMLDG